MYGLADELISSIQSIFKKYHQIEKVIIYGSRAKGNFRTGSDIDLTLVGDSVDLDVLNSVATELDDLLTPYTFDLSIFKNIVDQSFLEHIERVGKVFYEN